VGEGQSRRLRGLRKMEEVGVGRWEGRQKVLKGASEKGQRNWRSPPYRRRTREKWPRTTRVPNVSSDGVLEVYSV
jgi:hypothetical protein